MGVRFSVLIPVYNREKYLHQAIDSVLTQTFSDWEVLAVDDGSTDRSAEELRSYADNKKVTVLQQSNQGPEVARNLAAAHAQGEYLVFLDSDDYLFPFALATFDEVIKKFGSPPLVIGNMAFFQDGSSQPIQVPAAHPVEVFKYRDYLSKTRPLGTNCIVVRKSVFEAVGGMRKSTPETFHGDDTNLLLKVGTFGPCIVIDKPCTSAYRQHGKNSTKNLKAIADAILRLADTERRGGFGGGNERRPERYAYIGGRAASWAFNYCWRGGQRKLALRLLGGTAPMVAAAMWKKARRGFQSSPDPVIVVE